MKKMMKKAEMGMQTKPKKGKMISESGDLADALNETMRMRKAGTVPKTDKDAGKYMDKLSKKGKLGPKMKMGGSVKKAKDSSSFAKLAPPYDKATYADKIAGATKGKTKSGAKMKKAMMGMGMHKMPDGSMMKNSMMKMGGAMAKQAAVAIAMKKAGKSPKKKMGYGGEAAFMVPPAMMKKGGVMKKCKYGCK